MSANPLHPTHRLLARQISKASFAGKGIDYEMLLRLVSAAYEDNERTNHINERSMRLMSDEMNQKNKELEAGKDRLEELVAQRTQELTLAKEKAEAATLAKSEFLANMSHELRTPLNSILGMLRLLKLSDMTGDQQNAVDIAFMASTNLLEIVNDVLDLSKIEAGEVVLEHIGFDLEYVFHSVVRTLHRLAEEKRIALVEEYGEGAMPYVLGDPTRLGRILINLVSNAVKYTDAGQVTIIAAFMQNDAGRMELRCKIRDTGIGIPKEKQGVIFEKFVQGDASTTRRYGGTGLGLAITRELVEMMEGTIGVESEVGKGSTFWFNIPFTVTDKLSQTEGLRKNRGLGGIIPSGKVRVLVAEDHPLNQMYIRKVLDRFGIRHYEIVDNGQKAIERYKEVSWDVVLMDCHMPEKNGYDTTVEIRALEKEQNVPVPIPIVAMTANAMVGDKEKCLRCGMDDYVSKPIDIDELKDILAQWVRFEGQSFTSGQKGEETLREAAIVDLSRLRTFTGGDKEVEKEFISVFIEQSDRNMIELQKGCAHEDHGKMWQEASHMFKGGAGGIGAEKLYSLCDKAQHLDVSAMEKRASLFGQISDEYEKVKKYLKDEKLI